MERKYRTTDQKWNEGVESEPRTLQGVMNILNRLVTRFYSNEEMSSADMNDFAAMVTIMMVVLENEGLKPNWGCGIKHPDSQVIGTTHWYELKKKWLNIKAYSRK